jgi:predicted transglutaminase-like cysteine proteinase|tara:strand:- start:6487 stop:7239 length:753 start_codon:yes stop_codon:yes gene_type:complete
MRIKILKSYRQHLLSNLEFSQVNFAFRTLKFGRLCLILFLTGTLSSAQTVNVKFEKLISLLHEQYNPVRAAVGLKMQKMLENLKGADEIEKVNTVNTFFDEELTYQTDIALWHEKDYWASPLETLGKGRGDCEDYAIIKYFMLRYLGIDESQLRLVYVKARIGGPRSKITQAHMVLSYYLPKQNDPLILDSLLADVVPASQRTDLLPVFSFNTEGLWAKGSTESVASPTARLSRWRNALEKIKLEGITWG